MIYESVFFNFFSMLTMISDWIRGMSPNSPIFVERREKPHLICVQSCRLRTDISENPPTADMKAALAQ